MTLRSFHDNIFRILDYWWYSATKSFYVNTGTEYRGDGVGDEVQANKKPSERKIKKLSKWKKEDRVGTWQEKSNRNK